MKDELFHYCERVRSFLELRWQEKHLTGEEELPKVLSSFMCRYTSIFLQQVVTVHSPQSKMSQLHPCGVCLKDGSVR